MVAAVFMRRTLNSHGRESMPRAPMGLAIVHAEPIQRTPRKRATSRRSFFRASSCSHTRKTRQPAARSVRVTNWSRAWLRVIFSRQNFALFFGCVPCLGHPSTKTATFSFRKTKSGLPASFDPRRPPMMPCVCLSTKSYNRAPPLQFCAGKIRFQPTHTASDVLPWHRMGLLDA